MLLATIEPFLQVLHGKGIDKCVKEKAWIEITRRFNETTICEKVRANQLDTIICLLLRR